jgi:hypothetical protein
MCLTLLIYKVKNNNVIHSPLDQLSAMFPPLIKLMCIYAMYIDFVSVYAILNIYLLKCEIKVTI